MTWEEVRLSLRFHLTSIFLRCPSQGSADEDLVSVQLLSWSPPAEDLQSAVFNRPSPLPIATHQHGLQCVRAWASSHELRLLSSTPELPQPLRLECHVSAGGGAHDMLSTSSWRFTVVVDDRGVHMLDWLPRSLWPLTKSFGT